MFRIQGHGKARGKTGLGETGEFKEAIEETRRDEELEMIEDDKIRMTRRKRRG